MASHRRTPRWLRNSLIGALALVAIFYLGGGIVFSNMIHADALEPTPPTPDNGVLVRSVTGDRIVLDSIEERADTTRPGVAGLSWSTGYGRLGEIVEVNGLEVTREFTVVRGDPPSICLDEPPSCDEVDIEGHAYESSPGDVGLEYSEVTFEIPLGETGAWLVEAGESPVWAIHAHGWRSERRESLRTLSTYADLGITSLVIDYRNDSSAPADPSGLYKFGRTEWEDVEAAVAYALDHGAEEVLLVGYSTGAALHMAFLENSDLASAAIAAVFDSPNIDMAETVKLAASKRTIPSTPFPVPGSLTLAAMAIADLRWDVGWDEIAYVDRADTILSIPTLVFHGVEDDRVPIGVSRRLKENAPDQVELIEVADAGHVTSWNVDPARYESTLENFLQDQITLPEG